MDTAEHLPHSGIKSGLALSRALVGARTLRSPERFWRDFWARTALLENGCRVWTGAKNKWGYGILKFGKPRRQYLAHRVAYVYDGRELEDGVDLLHGPCNNPACLVHTYEGDQAQNNRDTSERGRHVAANQHFSDRWTAVQHA